MKIEVNGKKVEVDADPSTPVLWALRDHLGLTGTKYGCGVAACGACTVLLNGTPVRSCVTPIGSLEGQKITTIEGITQLPQGKAVKQAWLEHDVAQCGYCQSGQMLSATALLKEKKNPSDQDITEAMSGNICRCGTYGRVRDAIKAAAKIKV